MLTSWRFIGLMVMVFALGFVLASSAAEAKREITLRGEVKACPADCKLGCPATLEVRRRVTGKFERVIYNVVNDENGIKLAEGANGKRTQIKGTVQIKDRLNWLTVKEFRVIEKEGKK